MKYTITGDNLQFVNVQLEDGELFQSNAGSMRYMTGNMTMEAKMKGGFLSGLKRSISGSSLFLMNYRSNGGSGVVGFGGSAPGKILDVDVGKGAWLVQSSGYLCSDTTVNVDMAFQKKLGSMFFGGEGIFNTVLTGPGRVWLQTMPIYNVANAIRPYIPTGGKD